MYRKKKTSPKGSGYEDLVKCVTMEGEVALIDYIQNSDDDYAKTQLMNYTLDLVLAKEFLYHRSC